MSCKIIIHLLLFVSPLLSIAQLHKEDPDREIEDKDGRIKEYNERRLQLLIATAGTNNLSLVNYREFNRFKQKNTNTNVATGANGYTNFNGNWTQITMAQSSTGMGRINCMALKPGDPNTIFAGTPTGGLWRTTNNGLSWIPLTDALPVPGVSGICIDPNNTNIMYILTGTASTVENQSVGVFKSYDGGLNWQTTGLDTSYIPDWFNTPGAWNANKLVMDPNNSSVLLAALTTGLYRTEDGGATWSKSANTIGDVRDVAFHPTNSNIVYITYGGSAMRVSNNNGVSFGANQNLPHPVGNDYKSCTVAVTPAAPDSVFFAVTVDEPVSKVNFDSVYIVRAKYVSGQSLAFNGYRKCFCPTADEGYISSALRWYRDARLAISPTTTANMYIGGLWVYASSNYGNNWILKSKNSGGTNVVHSDCTQVTYLSTQVYTCNDGGLYSQAPNTSNGTSSWSTLTGFMPIAQIYKFGASQASLTDFSLALQDNGCHLRTLGNYNLLNGGDGLMARMSPATSGTYYYMTNNFVVSRVKAGITTSITPTSTTGSTFLPFEVDQNDETRLYTAYNDLYISTNEGTSWSTKTTPYSNLNKLIAVSKTNNQIIYLLADSLAPATPHRLWRTNNGGSTFQTIVTPAYIPPRQISSIVISPFDENRVYVTMDGYTANAKVFMTTNAGITWINISSGLPNIPVNCLVYESSADNSIYIGTEVGIYYYNTVISRWIPYNNGMPVCRVSELYINRSSLKVIAATYGRGMFISDLYGTCDPSLTISGIKSGPLSYSAGTTLNSTQYLYGGDASKIRYFSGRDVFLMPGFGMDAGTNFVATIGPCGGTVDTILNSLVRDTALLKSKNMAAPPAGSNKKEDDNRNKKSGELPAIIPEPKGAEKIEIKN